jgi:hypothetical protein
VSITVNQKPDNNSPAYNDLNFVITESDSAIYTKPNFKFIADVFQNTTRIARLKAPIYPNSTNKSVFNISRLIENFVTLDWDIDDTSASGCPNSYIPYKVNFGYEYSTGTTSPIIEVSGTTNVTGLTAYNMALNPIDFLSFDENDYLMTSSASKFLTSIRSRTVYSDQKCWLYFWRGNAGSVEIKSYPAATTQIILLSGITDSVVRVPIIPVSGSTYVEVKTKSGASTSSETYTIYYKDECSKYTDNDVYFLNRFGAVESFRFNRVRKDNYTIQRKQYQKTPYQLSGSSYNFDTSSQSKSNYYTESVQKITLNCNWISEEESEWLKELIMSPYIYLMDGGVLKAINITNTDYGVKTLVNDKVFNLTINCDMSFVDKVQRL